MLLPAIQVLSLGPTGPIYYPQRVMWACIIWGHSKTPLQLPKLEQNWYLSQHITCLESIISHGRVMKGCSIWPLAFMIRFSAGQNLIIQGAFVWTSSLFGIHWALRALLFEQCAGSACSRQSSQSCLSLISLSCPRHEDISAALQHPTRYTIRAGC